MSLQGKLIVFTGALQLKRADASKKAEACGATVGSSVTGKTNILVAGPDAMSTKKVLDAKAKGVEIWDEATFISEVEGGGAVAKGKGKAAAPAEAKAPKAAGKKKKAEEEPEPEAEAKPQSKKQKASNPAPPSPPPAEAKASKGGKKVKAEAVPLPPSSPPPAAPAASAAPGTPGGRRPNRLIPNSEAYTVYGEHSAVLNFTDISGSSAQGNNKFYKLQVVEGKGKYCVHTNWGRVGEIGSTQFKDNFADAAAAVKEYQKIYKEKTKKGYQLVELEEGDAGGGGGGNEEGSTLGRLSVAQIEKGQCILKQIRDELDDGERPSSYYLTLSSQFYSLIPTNAGRTKPPTINNFDILQTKENLLEFWLRMGFEEVAEGGVTNPIKGVFDLPVPPNLTVAASNITALFNIQASQQRGSELHSRNVVPSLGAEFYAAILLYTGNSIYSELNRVLRSESQAAARKYLNYLRLLFEAMSMMPKRKVTLWRGISVDLHDEYTVGKVVTWWSVSSCTADINVAKNFMQSCGGKCTLFTLECETAVDISLLSFYSHERESLLAPGTKLQVVSRKRNGNISEISVKEVGNAAIEEV